MSDSSWYDRGRVSQAGSPILTAWRAGREAERARAAAVPRNDATMSMSEFAEFVSGAAVGSSTRVTERTAMNIATVYACVNLIGGAISSMPLNFYRNKDGRREKYTPDEWWMLNEQMCPAWGAATGWEFGVQSLLLRGDGFMRIQRASRLSSKIVGFEPLHPRTVEVRAVDFGTEERRAYDIDPQPARNGRGQRITLDQDDVLHFPGPGFDGLRGMSQISSVLRNTGAIALSSDEYTAAFFRNSARPDFALQTEANLKSGQIQEIKDQIAEAHQGVTRAWRPMILHGGLKIEPITMTAEDAQLVAIRGQAVEEICRAMGVPPFMVGHTEKTTSWGSGVEQMSIGFIKYTLQRHLVKIEQEINRKLFFTSRNFCEFLTAGLERGDLKTRMDAYRVALGRAGEQPWMSYEEVRELENLPPREGLKPNAPAPAGTKPTKEEGKDDV